MKSKLRYHERESKILYLYEIAVFIKQSLNTIRHIIIIINLNLVSCVYYLVTGNHNNVVSNGTAQFPNNINNKMYNLDML